MAETINPQGTADFDWEALQLDGYNQIQRSEMSDRYEKTLTSINEREVIQGTVALITKKEVIINIGYKSEGVVAANEFRYNADLKIGDLVDVYVECREDKTGQLVVSHKTARMHSAWLRVNDVLRTGEIITGYVKCRTKGGLIVDVFGIEAFLPGSQIDVKPIRDYDVYVGKNMEFKVVKINEEFRNVVVSHKALIEAELEEQKKQIISGLEKGQVLEGIVKNITSYGVFIDLGGVDGLIHITDLSWGRVSHPEEMLELDQKINVVILDFDDDKKRIALGLKQLQPHPWDSLDTNLNVGDKVSGKVVVMADYGAFIELATGVEGLIHVSEMSWSQHLRSAQDFMSIGDTVEAVILTLDREDRKMSLGIKQSMPDPWNDIETKYAVGSKHSAKVRNFTNFGVFVEVFESTFDDGSIHSGTIIEMKDKSGIVSLPYGVEGICPAKHLKKEDGQNAKVEETLDFKVIEFNKELKKIVVSHTRTFEEGEDRPSSSAKQSAVSKTAKAPKKAAVSSTDQAVKAVNENTEKSTLGDFDALAELKEKMEKGE
ncbi:MAG: 30S ribosomal protein S1 [Flavobacteriales bacterium]|nr:30S ribosomal protein S1 [Flavobacteriales bacterium]